MSKSALVSVVTIFLNEERFIKEAIESVLGQTYHNWELLLVDDGSSDGSTEIAKRYANKCHGKVRYLEHEGRQNRGMSASRNLGLREARGEYIAFLDADDVWFPHKLEHQVAILERLPGAAMACGPAHYWYGWTGKPEDIRRDYIQRLDIKLDTLVEPPTLLILSLQNPYASLCDFVVRRAVVDHIGGYENSFQGMYEDQVFRAKLSLSSPAFVSSRPSYHYRQHPDSCTAHSRRVGTYFSTRRAYLNWLEKYLSKQGKTGTKVWKVIQKELWILRHPRLSGLSERLRDVFGPNDRSLTGTRGLFARLRTQWQDYSRRPPLGRVRFGHLRRTTPVSRYFGFDRGTPIDRYYIESFLHENAQDIRGDVLEIGNDTYTRQFGANRVRRSDVLHVHEGNPAATIVADLTQADHIPSNTFDCIILTQTLLCIYDVGAAIQTVFRILKPEGVALVTVPGISQISREAIEQYGQFWSFTTLSIRRLFEEVFPPANLQIRAYGNVLAAAAFLYGLVVQDLHQTELDYQDPDYEVTITVRAVKTGTTAC